MTTVNVYTRQLDASAQYRLILPALAIGEDVRVVYPTDDPETIENTDVAVINRPDNQATVDMIIGLRAQGTKVIVDVDDLYGAITSSHSMYEQAAELDAYARAGCEAADIVTATTESILAAYAPRHGVLLPNRVPEAYLKLPNASPTDRRVLGWAGTVASHPQDLQVTGGGVARALTKGEGWSFGLIGPVEEGKQACKNLGVHTKASASGWLPFDNYAPTLAKLSAGIVPLKPTKFNTAKSYLKLLEMSACGVPTIASPTRENRKLTSVGMGKLASTPAEWQREVTRLVRSEQARSYMAQAAREVAAAYTIEACINNWREVWFSG